MTNHDKTKYEIQVFKKGEEMAESYGAESLGQAEHIRETLLKNESSIIEKIKIFNIANNVTFQVKP